MNLLNYFLIVSFLLFTNIVLGATEILLSKSVYKRVPFSSQFIQDGALIRNVDYSTVNQLIPQIEKIYGIDLEDRGEAHITVITPPEAQGWFTDHKGVSYLINPFEMQQKYFNSLQNTKFDVVCVGKRKNESNGNIVFYLVVKSSDLFNIRKEIQKELESRAKFTGKKTYFNAQNYWPHITIGYVGGDIHGVSKGTETCDANLKLIK